MAYLKAFDDWMDPEKKFLFISINNFAKYLGVPQKAIHNLVSSKHLDSIVTEGRTFIPISTQYLSLWSTESKMDCESQVDDFWGIAKNEDKKVEKE